MNIRNILLSAMVSLISNSTIAQFYTIGTNVSISKISKTKNHLNNHTDKSSEDSLEFVKGKGIDGTDMNSDVQKPSHLYTSFSYPLRSIHVTSVFGLRKHPILKKYCMHNGLDLKAYYEDVYSMFPGIVMSTGQDKRSGKYVIIKTGTYSVSYCHLSRVTVEKGAYVSAGQIIAQSGNTGMSTGPHLHLTIKINGKVIDPAIILNSIKQMKLKSMTALK